jgi:hypothetical protein
VQVTSPLPATPPIPAAPIPSQAAPVAIPNRREDEPAVVKPGVTPPSATNGPTPVRPNVFQRAAAFLQTRDGFAGELAQRDQTITSLQTAISQRDQTIAQQTAELNELRSGRDQLQQAMTRLESENLNVVDRVAALGFEANRLPAAVSLDQVAENSIEGLQEKLKQENDPAKRGEIMQRMITLRDGKK